MTNNGKSLFVIGGCLLLTFLLVVCTTSLRAKDLGDPQKNKKAQTVEIYERDCARCHAADGSGDTPLGHMHEAPNFTDPEWWKTNAATTAKGNLVTIVTNGKKAMPAFGKKLKRSEINQLVDYVRRFRGQARTPVATP